MGIPKAQLNSFLKIARKNAAARTLLYNTDKVKSEDEFYCLVKVVNLRRL
jgi:hypothetical protein